jgi:hypothetical protein
MQPKNPRRCLAIVKASFGTAQRFLQLLGEFIFLLNHCHYFVDHIFLHFCRKLLKCQQRAPYIKLKIDALVALLKYGDIHTYITCGFVPSNRDFVPSKRHLGGPTVLPTKLSC